jgi:citron Rho-interacting kinase
VKRIIGRGNFADVKLAREKSSGNVYALKVVKKAGEKVSAFYEEERDIMARAASPWLTKLDYAFQVVEGKRAALCLGQQCEHLRFR